jgi:hypothetical protein
VLRGHDWCVYPTPTALFRWRVASLMVCLYFSLRVCLLNGCLPSSILLLLLISCYVLCSILGFVSIHCASLAVFRRNEDQSRGSQWHLGSTCHTTPCTGR